MIRRPRISPLFPYTTLFRSVPRAREDQGAKPAQQQAARDQDHGQPGRAAQDVRRDPGRQRVLHQAGQDGQADRDRRAPRGRRSGGAIESRQRIKSTRAGTGGEMGSGRARRGSTLAWCIGALCFAALPASPSSARDTGVDVSHFQGETGMPQANWNQLAAEGRTFAYIKATEGLNPPGNIDPAWPNNVQPPTNAAIFNGVYHFERPDNRPATSRAVQY